MPLGNPVLPFKQFLMGNGELHGRPVETDETALRPEANRLTEGHRMRQVNFCLCSAHLMQLEIIEVCEG